MILMTYNITVKVTFHEIDRSDKILTKMKTCRNTKIHKQLVIFHPS